MGIEERRRQMIERIRESHQETPPPEFLRTDGMFEISDAELARYFVQPSVPQVYEAYKKGGDFNDYLNGVRSFSSPAARLGPLNSLALRFRNLSGFVKRRLIRCEGEFWLFEEESTSEKFKSLGVDRLDDVGRPNGYHRMTKLVAKESEV